MGFFRRFGSVNPVPVGVHCTAFADMFAENGTWHLPGLPDYSGSADITSACNTAVQSFHMIVPSIQIMIPVSTWNDYHKIASEYLDPSSRMLAYSHSVYMSKHLYVADCMHSISDTHVAKMHVACRHVGVVLSGQLLRINQLSLM